MSVRVSQDFGSAKKNYAIKCARIESRGPVMFSCHNRGAGKCVLSVEKEVDASVVLTAQDTSVPTEDTGYDGDTHQLDFTGQALNHTPIVPGTLIITPATTGVLLQDTQRDGHVYTVDADAEDAGTIDYFTGDLVLYYPTGKAPNGQLNAAYAYQDETLNEYGYKNYDVKNVLADQAIIAKVATDAGDGSEVGCDAVATWA